MIEWNGERVASIEKAYRATVEACKLGDDVVVHSLRHTGITWLAIEGKAPYEICRHAGITMEVFEESTRTITRITWMGSAPVSPSIVRREQRGESQPRGLSPSRSGLRSKTALAISFESNDLPSEADWNETGRRKAAINHLDRKD
jgi:hypothetical protein